MKYINKRWFVFAGLVALAMLFWSCYTTVGVGVVAPGPWVGPYGPGVMVGGGPVFY